VICTSIRCDHERARCARCRSSECVHALDGGVCVPCGIRAGRGGAQGATEALGDGVVAHVFEGGVELLVWVTGREVGRAISRVRGVSERQKRSA
jgi:hypothetical protein